jgi:hypothetical protein
VITILVDHNIEGQAVMLWGTLAAERWLELLPIQLVALTDVGLPVSNDRTIWRFAQENGMLLLTDNRSMKGKDSLEQTIREESTPTSLPVLTISSVDRLDERIYRERCVERLLEIGLNLKNYLGTGRIFIP